MDIRMIKDILRLKYSAALSHEAIARSLGISKGVVAKYLGLAGAAGLDWPSWPTSIRSGWNAGCSAAASPRPRRSRPTSPACTSSCAVSAR